MHHHRADRMPRSRGQVVVIFAMAILVIVGLVGIVIDISWYWSNSLRIQRAADAAALAGAVDLPSKPGTAGGSSVGFAWYDALAEAAKNGYSFTAAQRGCGADNRTPTSNPGICVFQNPTNPNQLAVSIANPVGTFFSRVFGISTWNSTRYSKAEFTLPVPMGSPENYYGVFGPVRNATFTSAGNAATAIPNPPAPAWTTPLNADGNADGLYATSGASGTQQQWTTFNLTNGSSPVVPPGASIVSIQATIRGLLTGSGSTSSNCTVGVDLSWNNGTSWSTRVNSSGLTTTNTTLPVIGNDANTSGWGSHTWVTNDLSNANFRVRLTWNRGSCGASRRASVDVLTISVTYQDSSSYPLTGPGAACLNGVAGCYQATPAAGGQTLNPRGFWATMNTAGSGNNNGDAYQPYYDNPTSTPAQTCPSSGNACYDPKNYYNYAVEMPPNTTGGYVYIYDPVFCATALASGTGDRWFSGTGQVSSWYELFADTNNTPYNLDDDTLVATSGSTFQDIAASDTTMGGSGGSQCRQSSQPYGDARDFHDAWYLLNPGAPLTGGANGTVYRVHTTSSVPPGQSDSVNQRTVNGEQSFAIFANDAEGTTSNGLLPRVYGMGAMQMFTPLSGTSNSEFYLAQVPAYYAGKILEINLWDPGDTSPLAASLSFLRPTSSGWTPTSFSYAARVGTTNSAANSACNTNKSSSTSSVQTSTGASLGLFNGCWLTLDINIPDPSVYTGAQNGWWKIRYSMSGSGTSSDVTTWTATIKGNPVHLVVP